MKDMDGITVARKIREKDPYTILIFVSAYDSYFRQLLRWNLPVSGQAFG